MEGCLTPEKVKKMSAEEAKRLCGRLRSLLVRTVSENGGHLASNLGIVEISLALVRTLDLPREKVVYDTGHQCYVHKILTGREKEFSTLRRYGGISGFPRREESEFDFFGTGHSGTGISAALAFAKAARLRGEEAFSVAVIGDGAFTGGMVFEALNNISPRDRIIIILNDNNMSISQSTGRLRSAFNQLRTAEYYRFKGEVEEALEKFPVLGSPLAKTARGIKNAVKRRAVPQGNLFEEMGLHYFGPADGNDLEKVETLLREAKKRNGPSVIHLLTQKGKGYEPAEQDPARYHGVSPSGEKKEEKTFSRIFGEAVTRLAEKDERIVCITAAMRDGVGLAPFETRFPQRFFDTGIAEEHAMTFAAGLAASGMKPCFAVYSTFFQRSVDPFLHDCALQKLPCVVCLDRAGFSGEDGATHHGLFDLALTLPIPGVKIYAPVCEKELQNALSLAFAETERPSVIRYPKGAPDPLLEEAFPCREEIEEKTYGFGEENGIVAVSFGRVAGNVLRAAEAFAREGRRIRVVRFGVLKGFDEEKLETVFRGVRKLLLVEEGVKTGSFSEYLLSLLQERGLLDTVTVRCIAVEETFVPHGTVRELFRQTGMDEEGIERELLKIAET